MFLFYNPIRISKMIFNNHIMIFKIVYDEILQVNQKLYFHRYLAIGKTLDVEIDGEGGWSIGDCQKNACLNSLSLW